jgi:hypothetical protein
MNLRSFVLLLVIAFISCSVPTEYPRDNPNDPESELFKPEFLNFSARLNSDQSVTVSWLDQTEFESGYILQKELSLNSSQVLDTLGPSEFGVYKDETREFGVPTRYILSSFVFSSDSIRIGTTDTTNLHLGTISDLNFILYENPDSLSLRWNNSVKIDHDLVVRINQTVVGTLPKEAEEFGSSITNFSSPLDVWVSAFVSDPLNDQSELERLTVSVDF